nr:MAG TPA: hypothetical protein [Bacteriophage sp.]
MLIRVLLLLTLLMLVLAHIRTLMSSGVFLTNGLNFAIEH